MGLEEWLWCGRAFVVDHRGGGALAEDLEDEGFTVIAHRRLRHAPTADATAGRFPLFDTRSAPSPLTHFCGGFGLNLVQTLWP